MRIIVFFDLPTLSSKQKKDYTNFRKFLIKNGFFMMQQSVYTKIVLNDIVRQSTVDNIKKNKVKEGLIQVITVTEKQFEKMEFIIGCKKSGIIDDDKRLVII